MNIIKLKSCCLLLITLLLTISIPLPAEEESKKVGLVLSGGGALGMAHIGVLKMIEKYEIPIDYITGTSMGAIIGALYASGYSASEIEEIIDSIGWIDLLSDKTERKYRALADREQFEKSIILLNFEKLKPKLPEGLIYGQNIYNLLSLLTWHVREIKDFRDLPIPFKCVATDIQTGEAVVLEKGNLVDAVRASMAIPSVFSAIEIDGKLLVDGGVVRNIPVSDVKEMGADIVIASDVSTPRYSKEELDSFPIVIDQLIKLRFSTHDDYEKSLADLVIIHDLKDYNISSFLDSRKIIESGEETALINEDYFRQLSLKINRRRNITVPPDNKPARIDRINVTGNIHIPDMEIMTRLGIKENSLITREELNEAVANLYGTGDYSLIRYYFTANSSYNILNLDVKESTKQVISFGINYNNYDNASFLINTTVKDLGIDGSRIRLKTKLSENYLVNLRYSIPVLFDFFDLGADGEIYRKDFYSYDNKGNRESKIFSDFYSYSFFLEHLFSNSITAGISWENSYINIKDDISLYDVEEDVSYSTLGFYAKADTLDRIPYPRKGFNTENYLEYVSVSDYFSDSSFAEAKSIDNFMQIKSKTEIYFPLFSFLTLSTSGSVCLSGLDSADSIGFFTGGFTDDIEKNFIAFKGLFPGDMMVEDLATAEAALNIYLRNSLVATPFYSRLMYDIFDSCGDIYSYGISLALITPIGPVEIAGAKAESKDFPVFYFNIGFNF